MVAIVDVGGWVRQLGDAARRSSEPSLTWSHVGTNAAMAVILLLLGSSAFLGPCLKRVAHVARHNISHIISLLGLKWQQLNIRGQQGADV